MMGEQRRSLAGRGKSGSLRIIYLDTRASGPMYLITVFGKDEKDNLSPAEKQVIKEYVKGLSGGAYGRSV